MFATRDCPSKAATALANSPNKGLQKVLWRPYFPVWSTNDANIEHKVANDDHDVAVFL